MVKWKWPAHVVGLFVASHMAKAHQFDVLNLLLAVIKFNQNVLNPQVPVHQPLII